MIITVVRWLRVSSFVILNSDRKITSPRHPYRLLLAISTVASGSQSQYPHLLTSPFPGSKDLPSVPPASVDTIISLAENPSHHTAERVTYLSAFLKPGGTLIVQQPVVARAASSQEEAKASDGVVVSEGKRGGR